MRAALAGSVTLKASVRRRRKGGGDEGLSADTRHSQPCSGRQRFPGTSFRSAVQVAKFL